MKNHFTFVEWTGALADGKTFRAILSRVPDNARLSALGLVAAFHVVFLGVIAIGLRLPAAPLQNGELQVRFFPETRLAPSPPHLPETTLPFVEPPQIVMASDASTTVASVSAASILAPRPDPKHPNEPPTIGRAGGSALVLKLLVLSDGSVGDAQIATSCGDPVTDKTALTFVKEHWRFLPAMLRDTVIQYWTTVAVPLRAGR